VALGEGKYQSRKVVTGIETSGQIEVISGLKKGEKVVTSAQFLIDSEVNIEVCVTTSGNATCFP